MPDFPRPPLSNDQLLALVEHCYLNAPPATSRRTPFLSWPLALEDESVALRGIGDALVQFGGKRVVVKSNAYVRVTGSSRNGALMFHARKLASYRREAASGMEYRRIDRLVQRIDRYRLVWSGKITPADFKSRDREYQPRMSGRQRPQRRPVPGTPEETEHTFPQWDSLEAYLASDTAAEDGGIPSQPHTATLTPSDTQT